MDGGCVLMEGGSKGWYRWSVSIAGLVHRSDRMAGTLGILEGLAVLLLRRTLADATRY
jgi:hypothetical protein